LSDRLVRFPGTSWQEIEAPPADDPLPGGYELHPPADAVTIWYTMLTHEGQEIASVQHVKADT
jgi:hypothetical protein